MSKTICSSTSKSRSLIDQAMSSASRPAAEKRRARMAGEVLLAAGEQFGDGLFRAVS